MPLFYTTSQIEFLSPFIMHLVYIPYIIYLESEYYILNDEIHLNYQGFMQTQFNKISLMLKRDYYFLSDSSDVLLDTIHQEKNANALKEETISYQDTEKPQSSRKRHQKEKKFHSCPCFSHIQPSNLGMKKNQSMGFAPRKTFFNSKKSSNNELFMLLNSISVCSDDVMKQKLLDCIEKEGKCNEVVDSLIRRCLNSFTTNEARNLNKVNIFLCRKSKDKFAVTFKERVRCLIENETAEEKEKAENMKNVLAFLCDVINEKVLKKQEINEIIMRLLLQMIDFLVNDSDLEKFQKLQEKVQFVVILLKAGFHQPLNEEIVNKTTMQIMRKLNIFSLKSGYESKNHDFVAHISEKFLAVFGAQFIELNETA